MLSHRMYLCNMIHRHRNTHTQNSNTIYGLSIFYGAQQSVVCSFERSFTRSSILPFSLPDWLTGDRMASVTEQHQFISVRFKWTHSGKHNRRKIFINKKYKTMRAATSTRSKNNPLDEQPSDRQWANSMSSTEIYCMYNR